MKHSILASVGLILTMSCTPTSVDDKATDQDHQIPIDLADEELAVKKVMKNYKGTLESLDVSDSYAFFSETSEVLEQGKIEGTYRDYIANHIGPELDHFESFTFSDYKINVVIDLPYAFTTESYIYNIVLKNESRKVERKAAATSILMKSNGVWKILKTHSSSRSVN